MGEPLKVGVGAVSGSAGVGLQGVLLKVSGLEISGLLSLSVVDQVGLQKEG